MIECVLIYSLADYIFYGIVQDERREAPFSYRVFQVVACWIPIMFYLENWHDRIGFFLLWWTFCADWLYYAFTAQPFMDKLAHVLRMSYGWPKIGWDNWEDTQADFGNGLDHAYFTPIGLFNRFILRRAEAVPVWILALQSIIIVGLLISNCP